MGQAWIDMIRLANHADNKVIYKGKIVIIKRGEFIRSRRQLASMWGWSDSKVQRFLILLKNDFMIDIKSNQKANHIIILNYDIYQILRTKNEPPVNQERTTSEPPVNINNNGNKGKNEKKSKGTNVPSNNNCPHNDIISIYHEVLPEFPKVVVWNDSHKSQLRTRWKENSDYQSLEWWKQFFDYIRQSDFLMGRSSTTSSWQPDLEWLTKKTNFAKIANGRYHRDAHPLKGKLSDAAIQTMRNLSEINYEE